MKTTLCAVFLLLAGLALTEYALAEDAKVAEYGLVIYKSDARANDQDAGPFIDKFNSYLNTKVEGAKFVRRGVRNDPAEALKLLKDDKKTAAWAIVTPGFYFKYKDELKLTAIAEARRDNIDGEQYTLVGKTKADKYPEGKKIATDLFADIDYLNRVVLPAPKGAKPVQWVKASKDGVIENAYEIAEDEDGAPDFVLIDKRSMKAFDAEAGFKELKKGMQSKELPQDLVVEIDGRLNAKKDALKKALKELDQTAEGKKVGSSLQTPTFPEPNADRLKKAETAWSENK